MQENAPILFYDGHCNLCHKVVRFIVRRDKKRLFYLAPLQGETAAKCLPRHWLNVDTVILLEGKNIYVRSKAAFRVLKVLGFPYSVWSVLGLLPTLVTDWGYNRIAKHRYRWWGRREVCEWPDLQDQSRFLP
jgi:predicted DCC family thiol-disulfide oxidoreductase YuxK